METTPEQTAEGLAIVRVLAAVLDRLVGANAQIALTDPGQVTKFHAMKAPGIAIQQYLERIHKYASCSNECFILALIYIDRLIERNRNKFLLTELNVHRVIITAILLAAKFFDDAYYNNAYYAKVGGVLTSEINGLEVDFLFRINFSLHVTSDEFDKYRSGLITHLANIPREAPRLNISDQNLYNHSPPQLMQNPSPALSPSSHQVAAAAAAAISAQVAIQQVLDHQSNVSMFDIQNGMRDDYVHVASHITPSPPVSAMQSNHQLMSAILHPSQASATDEMIAAANNNFILQSLELIQQTLDNGNGCNNNISYPIIQRTNSMPVKLGCGSMAQYHEHNTSAVNHTNASFATNMPLSCPISAISTGQPYSYPMEEQYLRMLVESTQQQRHQQQQQQLHRHSILGSSTSSAYNNVIALQNEARRLALAQGHILAAAGLSGPVL